MPRFEYINDIPALSPELIDAVQYCATHHEDVWPFRATETGFEVYPPNKLLSKFIVQNFGNEYNGMVQVIKEGIVIHKDTNRNTAYNFIIDCGGEHAATCYYDDQKVLIEQIKIEPLRWHKLDVTVYHNVINLTHSRVALTVFLPK